VLRVVVVSVLGMSLVLVATTLVPSRSFASTLGTTWTQLSPATSPPARYGASMAYDPATSQLVIA